MGRDVDLENLHQQLQGTARVAIASVTGMGGVGKTELALQYARAQFEAKNYPAGVGWFKVRDGDFGSAILTFGQIQLGLEPPDTIKEPTDKAQWIWARWRPPKGSVLLVLDDVVDFATIRDYLPSESRFKIICTTRSQTLAQGEGFTHLSLDVLKLEDALKLLRSLAGDKRIEMEPEQAKQLCEWVGCLPLGLELVGQYLHQRQTVSLSKMLERLDKKRLEQKALQRPAYETTAEQGVSDAFELTWQDLTPEVQTVACMLSIFALAPIPWQLVEMGLPNWDEEDLEDARDGILVKQSLVKEVGNELYGLHHLMQKFLQEKLAAHSEQDSLNRSVSKAVVNVMREMPKRPKVEELSRFNSLLPHCKKIACELTQYLEDEHFILPFLDLAHFYRSQGLCFTAVNWLELGLSAASKHFGEFHVCVAAIWNNLAEIFLEIGYYEVSESLLSLSLCINEKILGKNNPMTALVISNLALAYEIQGKYELVKPLYLQALETRKEAYGEEHPDVALTLNNLAALHKEQGKYEQSEILYVQALEIYKKAYGEEHPDVALALNNLATVHASQGKYEQSETLYLEALEIYQKAFGDENPNVATVLHNLAGLYKDQGEYGKVEPLYLQALRIRRIFFGENHPDVALTLNNLATLYVSQEQYDDAESIYLENQSILEKTFGGRHPNMAMTLNNLARVYLKKKRYQKAENLFLASLEIYKESLGDGHPSLAKVLDNLAQLYFQQRKFNHAEPLYLQSLEIRRQSLSINHPDIAIVLHNLAMLYCEQGKYELSSSFYFQALEVARNALGVEHPNVAKILKNLALLYSAQEKYREAESFYIQATVIVTLRLGEEHPDTRITTGSFIQFLHQIHQAGLAHTLSDHPLTQSLLQHIRNNPPQI